MAKAKKERKNRDGSTTITMGDDRYFDLTEGGQERAHKLGYSGMIYTPQNKADIDKAHKMCEMGGAHGLVGAGMLLNYVALKVAKEEVKAGILNRKGEIV